MENAETLMLCNYCRERRPRLTCGLCYKAHYCRERCQNMDFEIGQHSRICKSAWFIQCPSLSTRKLAPAVPAKKTEDLDASALPIVFRRSTPPLVYVPYQAPPHVLAFSNLRYPFIASLELAPPDSDQEHFDEIDRLSQWRLRLPQGQATAAPSLAEIHGADSVGAGLLLVPRLVEGVYVLLGEEHLDMTHPRKGQRPAHRFVGASTWWEPNSRQEVVAYARALGEALGALHFQCRIDGYGFSVVGARPYQTSPEQPAKLYVQCDPLQVRRLAFDDEASAKERPDPELVDRLSFILERLAYTPDPRQADLFQAFREGYANAAPTPALKNVAHSVLNRLLVKLE